MEIRRAEQRDFKELYEIGKNTPELQVSSTEGFMDSDEFKWSIKDKDSVFLLAADKNKILGFIFANAKDSERPFKNRYACLVYLAVIKEARGKKIATKLYNECVKKLKKMKINFIYTWANENSGVIEFNKKQGFSEGHKYIWMDKKI